MERSAGRHQPSTTSTSSSSTGTLTFVTFPAPFRDLKEAISSSVDVKDMAHLSPLVIMRGLQKALMMPCDALFSNATALQVGVALCDHTTDSLDAAWMLATLLKQDCQGH
jgi:hypothetical protein